MKLKRILLILLLIPVQIQAQTRVLTLDQTLNTLYSLDSGGQKEFRWDPFFQEGSFSIGGHYGVFSTAPSAGAAGYLLLDNRDIYSVPLPYLNRGELVFPEPFVQTAREAFSRSIGENSSHYRIAAIIIDPGHGGKDPGATSNHTINGRMQKVIEKDINLNASRMLRDMLASAYPDKRILMTRERDITMSLGERSDIANSIPIRGNEAIIYISIHANYASNRNVRGYEVWYLNPEHRRNLLDESHFPDSPELRQIMNLITEEAFTAESIRIAESILGSMRAAMGQTMPSRGSKAENFSVVRRSNMPAVLVELGFVSNREDVLLMTSDAHLRKMVEAVYKGIADFVSAFEHSGGFIAAR
ncbi:MAG: N-acetylmuramoyl-L-alanine amidase [Treponema sp.]|nr:N-acetylmuramoyl-L-alanine amidase [Treponema sp.]